MDEVTCTWTDASSVVWCSSAAAEGTGTAALFGGASNRRLSSATATTYIRSTVLGVYWSRILNSGSNDGHLGQYIRRNGRGGDGGSGCLHYIKGERESDEALVARSHSSTRRRRRRRQETIIVSLNIAAIRSEGQNDSLSLC